MMKRTFVAAILAALAIFWGPAGKSVRAQSGVAQQFPQIQPIPRYHSAPPKGKLQATLPPRDFPGDPLSQRSYAEAAKMKATLYQLPCYCHCDMELGHTCLLSCYQDRHAAECGTCKMELYYAWLEQKKGKSVRQIRAGIIRGDWEKVDMSPWNAAPKTK